jgi:hypothetical protein
MAVPAPNLSDKTIPELIQLLSAGMVGSAMHQQATFMLQFRMSEKQAEAALQQATATEGLVTATQDLAAFTRSLVLATKAIVFFGGVTLLLTIIQVLKVLGWVQ